MQKKQCSLSVVIPCYNEKNTIEMIVDKVREVPIETLEIIVIDNVSTDGTRDILKERIAPKVSKIIYNETNVGKSGSVRKGIAAATADMVVIQDADMEYNPVADFPRLVQPIMDDRADVVYGSRFANKGHSKGKIVNYLGNRLFTWYSNLWTGFHLTDMETCYKVFRREIIQGITLVENGFGFEPEVTGKIAATGCRVTEIPIEYHPRTAEEGKKVRFTDGIHTLKCIYRYRNG